MQHQHGEQGARMEIHQESKGLPRTESWAFLEECQQEKTPEKKKGVEPLWMVVTWRPSLKEAPESSPFSDQTRAGHGHQWPLPP